MQAVAAHQTGRSDRMVRVYIPQEPSYVEHYPLTLLKYATAWSDFGLASCRLWPGLSFIVAQELWCWGHRV
jgi:hypothetical protein